MESEDTSQQAIAERCESTVHRILHALNAKDFSASTWEFMPPEFTVETWAVLQPEHEDNNTMVLHQWLKSVSKFAAAHPDYHFEISDLATTINEEACTAESILNVKVSGMYPGVLRKSVASFVFHLIDGKCIPVKHVALAGHDVTNVW